MKSCLKNAIIPANVRFTECHKTLELISSYLPWLLDEAQTIQYMGYHDPLEFTRMDRALNAMWRFNPSTECVCGALTEHEETEIILSAIPDRWKIEFRKQGGTHRDKLSEVLKKVNALDIAERQTRLLRDVGVRRANQRGGRRRTYPIYTNPFSE